MKKYAEGHAELTKVLLSREVIYAEDVEKIFGKRPWVSRTDEILKLNEAKSQETGEQSKPAADNDDNREGKETSNEENNENNSQPATTPPPFNKEEEKI